jgi:acetyl esterase
VSLKALLGPLIEQKGLEAALAEASPIMHIAKDALPFLMIHGDRDQSVPFVQSPYFQAALKANNIPCDLIIIPNGPHIGRRR